MDGHGFFSLIKRRKYMAIHIQVGKKSAVAVVFSCPGRHEEKNNCPAAKNTGKNLHTFLSILAIKLPRNELVRSNITITNAWSCVEYKAKTNRSEATDQEIVTIPNIGRLRRELDHITEFIIFCGKKAKLASTHFTLKNQPKFIYIEHLGTRGLLSITTDTSGRAIISADEQINKGRTISKRRIQKENTKKRLEVVAKSVQDQLV